jgi:hypothetical protein
MRYFTSLVVCGFKSYNPQQFLSKTKPRTLGRGYALELECDAIVVHADGKANNSRIDLGRILSKNAPAVFGTSFIELLGVQC